MPGRLHALASAFFFTALFAISQARAGETQHYVNARFGFAVDYPADTFAMDPPPDNDDGRIFRATSGHARFSVSGSYNATNQTAAEIADDAARDCLHNPAYRLVRRHVAVISCETPDGIVYDKTLLAGDVRVNFHITYPDAERERWDRVTADIANSLKILPH